MVPPRADVERLLPLKPTELLILLMLAGGERHGYGIRQDVLEHTDGAVELEAGNLYRHVRRLEDDGLVEESARRRAGDTDDERRRYYRLSAFGRRVLAAELLRLRALVRLGEARRVIPPETRAPEPA
jgi:DNA-binding PadR family transcriptional regulator